jgi:tetratricopeptide (TPR) repeat protein
MKIRYLGILSLFLSIAMVISMFYIGNYYYNYRKNKVTETFQKDSTQDEEKKSATNEDYREAVIAYNQQEYIKALRSLNTEIEKYPQHAQAYFLRGKIYEDFRFEDGKYFKKMVQDYKTYLILKPEGLRYSSAKLKLAQYYIKEGLKSGNNDLLDNAMKYLLPLNKENGPVKMGLGAIYLHKAQYDQAIKMYESAFNLPEDELKLKYNSLGLAYIKINDYQKAEQNLIKATKLNPENKYSHYMLGFAYMQQKKYKEAELCFVETLKIDPKYKYAKNNLRLVKQNQKVKE